MKTLVVDEATHQRVKEYCVANKIKISEFVIGALNWELDVREHLIEEAFEDGNYKDA